MSISNFVSKGSQYGVLFLPIYWESDVPSDMLDDRFFYITDTNIGIPEYWGKWIGEISLDQIKESGLAVGLNLRDLHQREIKKQIDIFFEGLMLLHRFETAHEPVFIGGSINDKGIDVDTLSNYRLMPRAVAPPRAITPSSLSNAAALARAIEQAFDHNLEDPAYPSRLALILRVFRTACYEHHILDRIAQYVRCIEGFLLPRKGSTKSDFKSRTELFIGPQNHKFIDRVSNIRDAVVHLHEDIDKYTSSRDAFIQTARDEAKLSYLSREIVRRILLSKNLQKHFRTRDVLSIFWNMEKEQREKIWGELTQLDDSTIDFHPKTIHRDNLPKHQ
jgi:hypothetical protein